MDTVLAGWGTIVCSGTSDVSKQMWLGTKGPGVLGLSSAWGLGHKGFQGLV